MKKRTRTPGFHSEVRKVNPYAGIFVCGDCGYNLQSVTCRDGYECGTYHKKGNTICYSHFIKKEVLDSIVINEIQRQAELALKESDKDEILKAVDRRKEVQRRCAEADQQIERLQKELAAVQSIKRKLMKIMWMAFWIKKNISPIRQNMKSRIKISSENADGRTRKRQLWRGRRIL